MNLFDSGDFILSSGKRSWFNIDCDSLTEGDWKTLAELVVRTVGPFASVRGVPRGGLKLAERLQPDCPDIADVKGPLLIVDDVLTTGGSMERLRKEVWEKDPYRKVIGAVIFARGPCPPWVKVVCQLPECLWDY